MKVQNKNIVWRKFYKHSNAVFIIDIPLKERNDNRKFRSENVSSEKHRFSKCDAVTQSQGCCQTVWLLSVATPNLRKTGVQKWMRPLLGFLVAALRHGAE
jgi:hypothetical protein